MPAAAVEGTVSQHYDGEIKGQGQSIEYKFGIGISGDFEFTVGGALEKENFIGILKQEIYYGKVYYSYEELKQAIIKYIDYYNNKRIKQKLGWLSPVEYRINALVA